MDEQVSAVAGLAVGEVRPLPVRHRDRDVDTRATVPGFTPPDFTRYASCTRDELEAMITWIAEGVGWFHSIDLPHGLTTPGGRGWEHRARLFDVINRVGGKRVLDLGAMEGGDAFSAEHAGADVTIYDVDSMLQYDLGRNGAWDDAIERHDRARAQGAEAEWLFRNAKNVGFRLCQTARRSSVRRISGRVYDLDPAVHGTFDIVYCFGLLYHLRHPLLALDRIAAVTREAAFVNWQILGDQQQPSVVHFFNDTWRGAHTNWFVPTPAAFVDLLGSSGFSRVEIVDIGPTSMSAICWK